MTKFFTQTIQVRLRKIDLQDIKRTIEKKSGDYENVSHFVRCAIIKLLAESKKCASKCADGSPCSFNSSIGDICLKHYNQKNGNK